jgi:hypothetical protein
MLSCHNKMNPKFSSQLHSMTKHLVGLVDDSNLIQGSKGSESDSDGQL